MIKLIINADDFGMSKIFNEKILDLLKKNFIKSTTVLVNRITKEQDRQVKQLIKLYDVEKISVGLHLEFNPQKSVKLQAEEQYQKFISIFGFKPSHLDIHKLIKSEIIRKVNIFVKEYNLPIRNHGIKSRTKQTTQPVLFPTKFDINEIIDILKNLKDGESYEIITHPGDYDAKCKASLNKERRIEYENIIKLQDFLKTHKNIKNISYLEL